jgi:AraC family transcriptional regulator, transcriptional activator of pobA
MSNIFKIESISQIHEMISYEKPEHPLISFIEMSKVKSTVDFNAYMNIQIMISLYSINMKQGNECEIIYGRKHYDFKEGSMLFISPDQIMTPVNAPKEEILNPYGWILLFHPDLIRKSALAKKMKDYTFFSYESHEALHVSEKEREIVTNIAHTIRHEYSQNLDSHSHELIISNLELLLNYCKRFYGRQFITRTDVNKDVISRFEDFIKSYFDSDKPESDGLLSVKHCATEMGYSPNYLSDLLKKETGKNTQEHIYFYLIEKAKNMLIGTEEPVYKIAYSLGFENPEHFSKLFKNKTGMSPSEYRN